RDLRFIPVIDTFARNGQVDRFRFYIIDGVIRPWQVHLYRVGEYRYGDDENNQQHQHDVHEGRHVDLTHDFFVVVQSAAECHLSSPLSGWVFWFRVWLLNYRYRICCWLAEHR